MTKALKAMAAKYYERLVEHYDPKAVDLHYHSPWELLVATVLAAQCTDARVNLVTPEFFRRWPGPVDLQDARQEDVEQVVRSTGFFRNKAKNLIAAARMVMTDFGGQLPRTMAQMTAIPGVARKTANIVLSTSLGVVEGIAVDTHAKRLAYRMGLTTFDDPVKVERDLMAAFERPLWGQVNHLLVQHGRKICDARLPRCSQCFLADMCPRNGVRKSA